MSDQAVKPSEQLQGEDWAGEMGERWLAQLDRFEAMIEPIGDALLERAAFQTGDRVVDIGPGGGATTRAIAAAVAPSGTATGIDVSPALVAEANRRAEAASITNVDFICADAANVKPEAAPFDRLFSRFGSMFFEEPVPAFANLHAMLAPGARIDLAVWGPPKQNLWMMEMMGIVRNHVEIPPAEPRAPGPFAFEDLEYFGEVLSGSGFSGMDVTAYDGTLCVGGKGTAPDDALSFVLSSLGIGRILDEQDEAVRKAASDDLLVLFNQRNVPDQGVVMPCKAWMVSATA